MMEILQYEFMRNALLAGILASVACGIIGVYVVTKRIVFISGGIAHASFGGIGIGYFLGINPVVGAVFFTIASAILMGLTIERTKIPEDTVIGVLWAIGMALGIIFIGLSPGYCPDLFGYLFGSILTVPFFDLIMMLVLNLFIIFVVSLLYKEFLILSFDEEFGEVMGLPRERLYLILLSLIALTIIILIRVVGIILVISLLSIPAAIARKLTDNLKKMMWVSIILSIIFTIVGLYLSYRFDLASGATIVLVSGSTFLFMLGLPRIRGCR